MAEKLTDSEKPQHPATVQQPQQALSGEQIQSLQQGMAMENARILVMIKGYVLARGALDEDVHVLLNMITAKALTEEQWLTEFGMPPYDVTEKLVSDDENILTGLRQEYEDEITRQVSG